MTTTLDLTTATPAQIDTAWAEAIAPLYARIASAEHRIASCDRHLEMLAESGRDSLYGNSKEDIEAKREEAVAERIAVFAELAIVESPFNIEYDARGGWTRAHLVDNTNGHVHSSRHCNTCFSTTSYYWVTALSGLTQDEIADEAGERACTVCYPNAPVNKPSRVFTPAEKASQADRDARAAKREAKAVQTALKAITTPDGSPLRLKGAYSSIKTLASAKQEFNRAVSNVHDMDRYSEREDASADQKQHWANLKVEYAAHAEQLADAIVFKTGEDRDALFAKSVKKAEKEWAASLKRSKAMGWI